MDNTIHQLILFTSSIYKTKIVSNYNLIPVINNLKDKLPGVIYSNRGGWQSDIIYYTDYDELRPIFDLILDKAKVVVDQIKIKTGVKLTLSAWININNKYSYNTRHNHISPNLVLSGVYYLKIPNNSGGIKFFNYRTSVESSAYIEETPENRFSYTIKPEEQDLIMFTPDMEHEVEQNLTEEVDDRRISIAFNIHE